MVKSRLKPFFFRGKSLIGNSAVFKNWPQVCVSQRPPKGELIKFLLLERAFLGGANILRGFPRGFRAEVFGAHAEGFSQQRVVQHLFLCPPKKVFSPPRGKKFSPRQLQGVTTFFFGHTGGEAPPI